jgi:hypothetical protein
VLKVFERKGGYGEASPMGNCGGHRRGHGSLMYGVIADSTGAVDIGRVIFIGVFTTFRVADDSAAFHRINVSFQGQAERVMIFPGTWETYVGDTGIGITPSLVDRRAPNKSLQRTCRNVTHFACAKSAPFRHAAE